MKFLKALGGVLCFIGCLAALMGILATAAPMIDNEQVRRILESFSVTGTDRLINVINGMILFCLKQNYILFGSGVGLLLLGGLMRMSAERALYQASEGRSKEIARAHQPATSERAARIKAPVSTPKPADPIKTQDGLSPYAAAEYGKALNRSSGRIASEIAEKYMPRSIIDTPSAPDEPLSPREADSRVRSAAQPAASGHALPGGGGETRQAFEPAAVPPPGPVLPIAQTGRSQPDRANGAPRFCSRCGAASTADAAFCAQCGFALYGGAGGERAVSGATRPEGNRPAAPDEPTDWDTLSSWQPEPAAPGREPIRPMGGDASPSVPGTLYATGREPLKRRPRIVSTLTGDISAETPQPEQATAYDESTTRTDGIPSTPTEYDTAATAVRHASTGKPRIVSTMGRKRES